MATSTVARTMATFLAVVLLGLVAEISAQSILSSNATIPAPSSGIDLQLLLSDTRRMRQNRFNVYPLTPEAGLNASATALQTWNINGVLRLVGPSTANSVSVGDIAFITCDSDGTMISPERIVQTAADNKPQAIVLYSLLAIACNLTGSFGYTTIYSTTTIEDATYLESSLQYMAQGPINAKIATNTTDNPPRTGTNNDGGPAPTTAVAMSILYSITGIITLLFLVIITTGALRAHRNPERYGPRRALGGRPRQSRAKGLARAMLETLPIVKFGDPEPAKPGSASTRDIELEDGTNSIHNPPQVTGTTTNKEAEKEDKPASPTASGAAMVSGMGPAQAGSVKSGEDTKPMDGELGCSICTEDFMAGEDVRVLPCQHKYHPACIDPWLLNVSGTCPLCRHDLNPAASADADGSTPNAESGELPPPLGVEERPPHVDPAQAARRRVSRFLDLHRLRTAPPDERIAALRRLREESRAEGETVDDVEEPSRRTRITNRLRDRFRIGTRQQPAATPQNDTPQSDAPQNQAPL